MTHPRLDILIYAHDGRGLGHASRSIGIGMALRRLYPDLKVLFLSGSSFSAELIGSAPLDWLKLPSYATRINRGKSRGISGPSNYTDRELGTLRAEAIKQVVQLYRPRAVLCDHSPQGKHRELLPAQKASQNTQWMLGVRGVVGAVPQVFSEEARETFKHSFHTILWYGDEAVLGSTGRHELEKNFSCPPVACGYVSRLKELTHWQQEDKSREKEFAGIISIPWQGEHSHNIIRNIATALEHIGPGYGQWNIFLGGSPDQRKEPGQWLQRLPHVRLHSPGSQYAQRLQHAKTALIYGGYNSITDVLCMNIPSVILVRAMGDKEQQRHLHLLAGHTGNQLRILPETEVTATTLEQSLRDQLNQPPSRHTVNINGAEQAARLLARATGHPAESQETG